ncbi:anhydro-N-acetylmuramic acid kinase [Labrenzia sp. THAF82]|uniref:GNAT family N-acetyltransferase n=1 Tax=Labrenzia sp. THAF82 TaxID=2587861 RepID=UPI0012A832BB|nr:GNAT family N-acetyltransferase [Labrenzia sp. THAF82]QFT31076.1 anhydro-N-acetylmuramic acid kinase [Labrenzia sp. THAF82]
MSDPILVTQRLRLTPFLETDYELLRDLHSDPEVNRYHSPGLAPMAEAEVRRRLTSYVEDHRRTGISKWKLETIDEDFIGRAGFSWQNEPDGYELGYSLKQAYWRQGYASEIAIALVDWFFSHRAEDQMFAYAASEHQKSFAVMEKAGLRPWMEMTKHGVSCRFYRITRQEHERARGLVIPTSGSN